MAQNDEVLIARMAGNEKTVITSGVYVLAQIEAAGLQDELDAVVDFDHPTFGTVRVTFSRPE